MAKPLELLEPIDLLLEQGSADELQQLRHRLSDDPLFALEVADTVALVEQLRAVRTEPSPAFAGKLASVVQRAERRLPQPRVLPWLPVLVVAAAAAATFWLGAWCDPLALRVANEDRQAAVVVPHPAQGGGASATGLANESVRTPTTGERQRQKALAAMRQRFGSESATHLEQALEAAEHDPRDALGSWLDPRNSLALLRLDHELRSHLDVRLRALRSEGAMVGTDERAQHLANVIAGQLPELTAPSATWPVGDVGLAVRALIAAGATSPERRRGVRLGSQWLVDRLPTLFGGQRVQALAALVECAAVEDFQLDSIAEAGRLLVDEVIVADDETWHRRRPDLLTARVDTTTIGDAGRTLAILPAFGVPTEGCALVRQLLLGQLRERREADQDQPEVLAAMLFGFADLMAEPEHDALVRELRRWKPARLAPDFATVHQLAWGVEPGRSGFTHLQRDLRQLVILPTPSDIGELSSLCLCLTTNYAARRAVSLERFMVGE